MKSVSLVCKKAQRGLKDALYTYEKRKGHLLDGGLLIEGGNY